MEFVFIILIVIVAILYFGLLWLGAGYLSARIYAPTFFRLGADSARSYLRWKDISTVESWLAIGDDLSKNRITGNRKNYVAGFNSVLVANGLEPVK